MIHIALSDLHFEHPTSLLQFPYAWNQIADTINANLYGQKYCLVMMGDVIDLCFSTTRKGLVSLSEFLKVLIQKTGLSELVWIIGNHDYHYYSIIHKDDEPYANSYERDVSKIGSALREISIPFQVVYPSYYVWQNEVATCFTHGHLFGLDGRLFSHLLHEAQNLEDVCSLNHAWIEFAWWLVWRDPRIAKRVWNGYDIFSAFMVESWRHKTIRNCAKEINHWVVNIANNSPSVRNLVYGHLHESGQEKIEISHSVPVGGSVPRHTLRVTNTGGWIIDKRIRRNPDKYHHPDSCFAILDQGIVKLKKVTFKQDYIQTIGNKGNIKHPLDFGMWWERT